MRKFVIRVSVYSIPLWLVVVAVILVDPYYLFTSSEEYDESKFKIGYAFDQGRRYKIFTYLNEPTDKIILGASEINLINEHNIPEEGWHSLSYGGAPLQESLRMYWEVSKEHKLSKVLIAPEFIKYYNAISSGNGDPYYANFTWNTSQSKKAFDIYNNKLDYFIDKYTLKSSYQYMVSSINLSENQSVPDATKEQFWKIQMDYAHQIYDSNIVIEDKLQEIEDLFAEIHKDGERKGVEFIIVMPVQHVELLRVEFQERTLEIYKSYLKMLIRLFGSVHYFAYIPNVSNNDDLFSDPFHFSEPELYLRSLWGNMDNSILTSENVDEIIEANRAQILISK